MSYLSLLFLQCVSGTEADEQQYAAAEGSALVSAQTVVAGQAEAWVTVILAVTIAIAVAFLRGAAEEAFLLGEASEGHAENDCNG